MALWGGRFEKETDQAVKDFSSSIDVDQKLWEVDIKGSIAHAEMLAKQNIIPQADGDKIVSGLLEIAEEISSGKWTFDPKAEDVHGEIEARLFDKIGLAAKKMHTARSRNDQVATDTRMYLIDHVGYLTDGIKKLQAEIIRQAEEHVETILPGMTHLQHAQPVSLAHHLMAYFWMFQRDFERFEDSVKRIAVMPLGSAALAGTGFPIDREYTCRKLDFIEPSPNSLDAVSDRDFVIEFLSNASMVMMHLSRMSEEFIIWSTPEFGFVELGDEVTTGSSIMPQKKNPDVAELIRGRVGRVYGALMGALTMMKGLPMSYNRDMQEDKIHLFEGLETVSDCVNLMTVMLSKAKWREDAMAAALTADFSNATDLADDLVEKGLSFREAHEVVGHMVRGCIAAGKGLEDLSLTELKKYHALFDATSLAKASHEAVLHARKSFGGTSPEAVNIQIKMARSRLDD
ncbi:MAG TPA: argininosuccinate lyase [Bdellovibrionales bacterium]|nr:argininosuccinate lyase [Bdellovibrionales bacterium]